MHEMAFMLQYPRAASLPGNALPETKIYHKYMDITRT